MIYVADDPGVSAGMAEQDSRGFAIMSDLPMLEPASGDEAYTLVQTAFELSEQTGTPVFIRLVTANGQFFGAGGGPTTTMPGLSLGEPVLIHDIDRFTKAGAAICMAQHRDLIARLEQRRRDGSPSTG